MSTEQTIADIDSDASKLDARLSSSALIIQQMTAGLEQGMALQICDLGLNRSVIRWTFGV